MESTTVFATEAPAVATTQAAVVATTLPVEENEIDVEEVATEAPVEQVSLQHFFKLLIKKLYALWDNRFYSNTKKNILNEPLNKN